jgi:hypothetical protein
MRGLTREERAMLQHLATPGDDMREVFDHSIHDRLVERGLVDTWVGPSPNGPGKADFWEINDRGLRALRVCTVAA